MKRLRSEFGWVEIDESRYENDIIVHVDGSISKRKKKLSRDQKEEYGHTPLSENELDFLEREHPKVVIIGSGQDGSLPITPRAKKILSAYETIIENTPGSLDAMAKEERPYVAIIHVTC